MNQNPKPPLEITVAKDVGLYFAAIAASFVIVVGGGVLGVPLWVHWWQIIQAYWGW